MNDFIIRANDILERVEDLNKTIEVLESDLSEEEKNAELIKESDLWSLDITLCNFILPRLKAFKEINTNSYPMDFKNTKEWHKVIDKMIFAFQAIKDDAWGYDDWQENYIDRYNEGMQLFAEHFCSLWD